MCWSSNSSETENAGSSPPVTLTSVRSDRNPKMALGQTFAELPIINRCLQSSVLDDNVGERQEPRASKMDAETLDA